MLNDLNRALHSSLKLYGAAYDLTLIAGLDEHELPSLRQGVGDFDIIVHSASDELSIERVKEDPVSIDAVLSRYEFQCSSIFNIRGADLIDGIFRKYAVSDYSVMSVYLQLRFKEDDHVFETTLQHALEGAKPSLTLALDLSGSEEGILSELEIVGFWGELLSNRELLEQQGLMYPEDCELPRSLIDRMKIHGPKSTHSLATECAEKGSIAPLLHEFNYQPSGDR